jgi:hypothetical protein
LTDLTTDLQRQTQTLRNGIRPAQSSTGVRQQKS